MTIKNLDTLIVGCGNIAGAFDFGRDGLPSTHAGAYSQHGRFNITACVDPDKKKLDNFIAHFPVKNIFFNIKEVQASGLEFDVISICTPTSSHFQDIIEALKLNPKLIFCEKPLADTHHEILEIKNMCKEAGVLLAVNYTRRWDPAVIELRREISQGELGEIRSVVGYYNKGILNNGSHMIDLLLYLFGSLNVVTSFSPVRDYFDDDPSVNALLNTSSGLPVHLVATHAADYALFELEVIGSVKAITMRDGGLNWSSRSVITNPRFKDYKSLKRDEYVNGRIIEAMLYAVGNIYDSLTEGKELLCSGKEASEASKICFELLEKATQNNIRK